MEEHLTVYQEVVGSNPPANAHGWSGILWKERKIFFEKRVLTGICRYDIVRVEGSACPSICYAQIEMDGLLLCQKGDCIQC